eukprot:scaffold86455_cov63-Phaeocystis_antarctica.AAC.1
MAAASTSATLSATLSQGRLKRGGRRGEVARGGRGSWLEATAAALRREIAACTVGDGAARLGTARTGTARPLGDWTFLATGLFWRAAFSCGWGEPRFDPSGEPSRVEPRLTFGEVAFRGDRPFRMGLLLGVPAFFGLPSFLGEPPTFAGDSWILLRRPALQGDFVAPRWAPCVGKSV